jgi:hypothetical protein
MRAFKPPLSLLGQARLAALQVLEERQDGP